MPRLDTQDTELDRKAKEGQTYEDLYDPPVDGATPLDGSGNPRTSTISLQEVAGKLVQGFTKEPVGAKKR